jgi:predicted transcriptional regulator
MTTWKDDYERLVAEIVSTRRVTFDELADRLDLLRDDVEQITERLVARGIIEPSAVSAS